MDFQNLLTTSEIKQMELKKLMSTKLTEIFNIPIKCKITYVDIIHHYENIGNEIYSDIFFDINSSITDDNELIKCSFYDFMENSDEFKINKIQACIQLFVAIPEFNISEPDTYILIKGIGRMIKRYLIILNDKHNYYLENKKTNLNYENRD